MTDTKIHVPHVCTFVPSIPCLWEALFFPDPSFFFLTPTHIFALLFSAHPSRSKSDILSFPLGRLTWPLAEYWPLFTEMLGARSARL